VICTWTTPRGMVCTIGWRCWILTPPACGRNWARLVVLSGWLAIAAPCMISTASSALVSCESRRCQQYVALTCCQYWLCLLYNTASHVGGSKKPTAMQISRTRRRFQVTLTALSNFWGGAFFAVTSSQERQLAHPGPCCRPIFIFQPEIAYGSGWL
jgi:hypothetical protein